MGHHAVGNVQGSLSFHLLLHSAGPVLGFCVLQMTYSAEPCLQQ